MRGTEGQTGVLFSYFSPEALVPRTTHCARSGVWLMRRWRDCQPTSTPSMLPAAVPRSRRSTCSCDAAAGLLQRALGTPTHGADDLQPAVPLVRRPGHRRAGLGRPVFTKNRDRLLEGDIAAIVPASVLADPVKRLLSSEHFSVDGTLIEAWASIRASGPRTAATTPTWAPVAMPSGTSTARSAATRRTPRSPIPMPGSIASRTANHRACASWGTC